MFLPVYRIKVVCKNNPDLLREGGDADFLFLKLEGFFSIISVADQYFKQ